MPDLYNTGMRDVVDGFLLEESRKVRDYGNYWSASSAGYCQRKIMFERLGVPHVETDADARKQRVFTSGHLFHAWMQGLTKEAGISLIQEAELQDEDLMIRGHFDDLILRDGKLVLYDYKTVNSRAFGYKKDEMSHFHRMQLGTYMYMLRKKGNGIMSGMPPVVHGDLTEARTLLISKDDLRMKEQQIFWDDKLEQDVLNFWKTLNENWEKKVFPPCTCADHENGFMARKEYNPYFYDGEPCNIKLYNKWKEETK